MAEASGASASETPPVVEAEAGPGYGSAAPLAQHSLVAAGGGRGRGRPHAHSAWAM